MADIQELTQSVLDKVKAKHQADYDEYAEKLDQEKNEKMNRIDEKIAAGKEHNEKAADAKLQRDKQSYVNELRNKTLKAKQQLIRSVYSDSVTALNQMSSDEFKELIRGALNQVDTNKNATIHLGDKSQDILSTTDKEALQTELSGLVFADQSLKNKSGFILASEGMDYNFTYEAIIDELKDQLAQEIAKRGF